MNTALDTVSYGEKVNALIEGATRCPLDDGTPNRSALEQLRTLSPKNLFETATVRDHYAAEACIAGLWLLHNFLSESHEVSQQLASPEGSFWHAIMHRREGDYGNSKYWFRQVGSHQIFSELAEAVTLECQRNNDSKLHRSVASGGVWNSLQFVDVVAQECGSGSKHEALCELIQEVEWQLLFNFCFRRALGAS